MDDVQDGHVAVDYGDIIVNHLDGLTNNTNHSQFEAEFETLGATFTIIIIGILFFTLIFISIAGNILVCVAIWTDRGLRRIGNLFLASLAIADLFVASLVMTFAGINDLQGYWMFGPQFCDTWVAFDVMCSTASILNLCAISLDRYIHIKDPLRYSRWVTRRVALTTIGVVWLLAGLISFVPISLGIHRPDQPPQMVHDKLGQERPTCALDISPTYAVTSSCISFFIPTVIMLSIYCRLYCYAQKHVRNIRAITRPIEIPNGAADDLTLTSNNMKSVKKKSPKALQIQLHNQHSSPYHASDHKAAITVGIIMGVFLVCWVPFFIANILVANCKDCVPDLVFKILTWLGYSNSAFNPIIYSIFNSEFRQAFKKILVTNVPTMCKCKYRAVNRRADSCDMLKHDRYVTEYGARNYFMEDERCGHRRRDSARFECSSDRKTSVDSIRHVIRVNSKDVDVDEISAI